MAKINKTKIIFNRVNYDKNVKINNAFKLTIDIIVSELAGFIGSIFNEADFVFLRLWIT